jgi:hypothetical protein
MNPLYGMLGGAGGGGAMNPKLQMIQQFRQFKQGFQGDPKAEIMKLVQSGKISQQQLNEFQQIAREFQNMMGNQ